jgi:hypothetical protein
MTSMLETVITTGTVIVMAVLAWAVSVERRLSKLSTMTDAIKRIDSAVDRLVVHLLRDGHGKDSR